MKKLIACFAAVSVLALASGSAEPPGDPPSPGPLILAAADVQDSEDLSTFEKVSIELAAARSDLEAAPKTEAGGFQAVEFTSSLECGGLYYTDSSFLILPSRTPYDKTGAPIDVSKLDAPPPKTAPIALLVAYAEREKTREALE